MNKFRKLFNNLLSPRAVYVLGPTQYARYVANFFACLPKIRRGGDLRPLDQVMRRFAKRFRYRGYSFFLDCPFCDEHIRDGSFSFGVAREIYIRDCYFKWQPPEVYERAKNVVDLGANRGAFSSLLTTKAQAIISVECCEKFVPVIHHNMGMNHFTHYVVETAFVGEGGSGDSSDSQRLTIEQLLQRHHMESVDLMKMDIEGSEFALFRSADWLERVNALSMEVHPKHGDPNDIVQCVSRHGFTCKIADENLHLVRDAKQANFLYAWKTPK